jgi:hypothetical protein
MSIPAAEKHLPQTHGPSPMVLITIGATTSSHLRCNEASACVCGPGVSYGKR